MSTREINLPLNRRSPDIRVSVRSGGTGGNTCRMLVKTCSEWESTIVFVPGTQDIIVYSDYYHNQDNSVAPRIKIGDGVTDFDDLPWLDGNIEASVNDVVQRIDDYIVDGGDHLIINMPGN